jgi:lysozyme family protein
MTPNFAAALNFVWRKGFDSPSDGYHVTPGDPGGGTFGGITEATWANAVGLGLVHGVLAHATIAQLSAILRSRFWGDACDAMPAGLDLLLFNGRMMSGRYPKLFQQGLGFTAPADCDGAIGPETIAAAKARDAQTFIHAMTGIHYGYLSGLAPWVDFGGGWTKRLIAAREAALLLLDPTPPVA